jgi:hypothetical protein
MVAMFSLPYAGSAASAASSKDVLRQTAVLFPVGNMVTDSSDVSKAAKAADQLSTLVQKGFAGYPKFLTVEYSERLPSVQRLANVDLGGQKLTSGPFAGDPDAMKRAIFIAKAMSADVAVTGTLDFYKFDPAKGEASVTATVQMVDVRTGKSTDTTVTGRASKAADSQDATESTLVGDAVREAGKKIMEQITGGQYDAAQQEKPVVVATPEKKKSKKSWLPMLLISLGVGLLLGGGGGGGGTSGGGDDLPPPIPL